MPTYHPAAFLHNPGSRERFSKAIVEDMRLAQKVLMGDDAGATIVNLDHRRVTKAFRALASCERLTCDLEWEVIPSTKKDPDGKWPWSIRNGRQPTVTSMAFAGRVDGEIVSCAVEYPSERYDSFLRKLLKNRHTVYHNAMADLIWLYSLDFEVLLGGDTMLLAGLLNLDTSLSLKSLASLLTTMPPGWEQESKDLLGRRPQTVEEWRRHLTYNSRDCVATLLLEEKLLEMVEEREREAIFPLYNEVLLPAVKVLARAALYGAPMDEEMLKRAELNARKKITRLIEKIGRGLDLPGNYESIINGPKLGEYIEKAVGVTLPRTPKRQEPSAKAGNLLPLAGKHPAIDDILSVKKVEKFESGYLKPWSLLLRHQGDARLHTVYRLGVARTGRTSAEGDLGYTLQQFIRQASARGLVKARDGWGILAADQATIELRIAAWKANEQTMIRFFNEGVDLHTATAGFIKALGSGLNLDQYTAEQDRWLPGVTNQERYGAKPYNFGLLYGGQEQVVIDTALKDYGIALSFDQAKIGKDGFFMLYPDLEPWHDSCWRFVQQGYTESAFHRRRDLTQVSEDDNAKHRKAINTPVQADASDLSLFCTTYSYELFEKEYGQHLADNIEIFGFFHDAEIAHFRMSEREAIEQIVTEAFEHPPLERVSIELPVPLKVDIEIGERWK